MKTTTFYKVQYYSNTAVCWMNLKGTHDSAESAIAARKEYIRKHPKERTRVLKLEQSRNTIVPTVVEE